MSEHPAAPAAAARPWYVPMTARRPDEGGRVSTPLELLFDLCFVVAIAQGAAGLDHAIVDNHVASGVVQYLMVFFAIWWAWMNFTWFASAYDNDDVPYRLTVLVQIAGSLVMAAGIPRWFDGGGNVVIVIGYVIMRLAMVTQWIRAARSDPPRRRTDLRYAVGVSLVQLYWLLLLWAPVGFAYIGFAIGVIAELAVPVIAERPSMTTFHPHHIAERYGLFTVIVLGESVTAAALAFQGALDDTDSATLIGLAVAGVVILFCMWWVYFDHEDNPRLDSPRSAFIWGYGHYFVFAAAAAVGAGLVVAVSYHRELAEGIGQTLASTATTVPVAVYLVAVAALRAHPGRSRLIARAVNGAAVLVAATSFLPASLYVTAGVLAVLVLVLIVSTRSRSVAAG